MSREIKFRVWSVIRESWVHPVLDITNDFKLSDNENRVIEQFTGLKDKNGVDIYEGDIVSTRTLSAELNDLGFENYEVGFFNGTFCLIKNEQAIRQWKDGTNDWYSLENTESFEIEIIGNIHETKS
jgi:uncharacterized phage protein (TIGR01671 family)